MSEQLLGHLVRVGPGAVLMRVVGLERDVLPPDEIQAGDADAVFEEAAGDLAVVVLRRSLVDVALAQWDARVAATSSPMSISSQRGHDCPARWAISHGMSWIGAGIYSR